MDCRFVSLFSPKQDIATAPEKSGFSLAVHGFFVMAIFSFPGCAYFAQHATPQRLDQGFAVVLPGIEGESVFNSNIAQGLIHGGVESAVEVHDWTTGHFSLFLVHLRHLKRNRDQAENLARKIVEYQDRYPDRPVYLIGHSGGGGMALLTLEALPTDRKVTGVILLAAAVSRTFDLRKALSKTERGIWNFYSPGDFIFLIAGTTLFGTYDGKHEPAAGAFGFKEPAGLDDAGRNLYHSRLHQVPFNLRMITSGNWGGHFGPSWIRFSKNYLAPILHTD
jgi:pimeloyl-ACP methyl ester carboxylesterase